MEKHQFLALADECLEHVASWLEDFDPDEVDFTTTDGVVAIEFPDGGKFILNRQSAADQMWFAAGVRAWHYNRHAESGEWRCDRDEHELYARIGEVVSERIGRVVKL